MQGLVVAVILIAAQIVSRQEEHREGIVLLEEVLLKEVLKSFVLEDDVFAGRILLQE